MDITAIVTEYWPVVVVVLGAVAVALRAIAKKTKTDKDDKAADILDQIVDAVTPDKPE